MTMVAPGAKAELAVEDDGPIPYMQRTRDYYVALGYGNPYRWAHFDEVPFTPPRTPLNRARSARACTARRRTGVTGRRRPTPPSCGAGARRTASTPPCSSPADPCATRP